MEVLTKYIQTDRLKMAYYEAGDNDKPVIIFVHGNVSSAVFYLKLMERLKDNFHMFAVDLSGFGHTEPVPIDASLGMRQWSEDLHSFVEALALDDFVLFGWSMGGGVVMQYTIDHCRKVRKLILQAPLSPYGYGGTYGESGKMLAPPGLGSGAGCANQQLIEALKQGDREFMKLVMNQTYFCPPFELDEEWESLLTDSMAMTRIGEDFYPGNIVPAGQWPNLVAGDRGICNTMSPVYSRMDSLTEITTKPDILWIRGDSDMVVGDECPCDIGYLGKIGAVPGYPGEDIYPNQPMIAQTRHVLDDYQCKGGKYLEVLFEGCGHSCHLENEDKMVCLLKSFVAP